MWEFVAEMLLAVLVAGSFTTAWALLRFGKEWAVRPLQTIERGDRTER